MDDILTDEEIKYILDIFENHPEKIDAVKDCMTIINGHMIDLLKEILLHRSK